MACVCEVMLGRNCRQTALDETTWNSCVRRVAASQKHQELHIKIRATLLIMLICKYAKLHEKSEPVLYKKSLNEVHSETFFKLIDPDLCAFHFSREAETLLCGQNDSSIVTNCQGSQLLLFPKIAWQAS